MATAEITHEQRLAIDTQDRPVSLVAGAGSGKTTVLVRRYLSLLAQGIAPRRILAVTFTTDAAEQLRARCLRELEARDPLAIELREAVRVTPYLGTLHSFCYGLLDQFGSTLGLPAIEGILTPFSLAVEFDRAYREWLDTLPPENLRRLLSRYAPRELRELARIFFERRHLLAASPASTPEDAAVFDEALAAFTPLAKALEASFRARGLYGFDDLEALALRLLREVALVRDPLRDQFAHILVDEFQDTSQMQWDILKELLGTRYEKLFVVGDPKQSIYSFRQADFRLFQAVDADLRERGGESLALTANFRSRPALLGAVNDLAEGLFDGTRIPFAPMQAGREATDEKNPLRTVRYEAATRPELWEAEKREVVRAVRKQLADGVEPGSLAILFRVSDRIPAYFQALTAEGIPVRGKRTSRLFESYDALGILSFLKAVRNPLDDNALATFLRSPFVDLGYGDLAAIHARSGESLYEKGLAQPDDRTRWFYSLIETGAFDVETCLSALFTSSKYWGMDWDAIYPLLQPLSVPGLSVAEAVSQIDSWEKDDLLYSSEGHDEEAVRLMTVHAAKGLEFPHVFLVDCLRLMPRGSPLLALQPGQPPALKYRIDGEPIASAHYEKLQDERTLGDREESKRILYVALTRAEETLTLFLPRQEKDLPKETWAQWLHEALIRS